MTGGADLVRFNFDQERAEHVRLKIHVARTARRSVPDVLREHVSGNVD